MAPVQSSVLVVEDDEDLLAIVELVLNESGFDVWTATDGERALEAVERRGMPDLILLDMRMPRMDGPELVRALHATGDVAPIVVMTAAENVALRAAEVNAVAWLSKPFDVDELRAVARRYSHREARQEE